MGSWVPCKVELATKNTSGNLLLTHPSQANVFVFRSARTSCRAFDASTRPVPSRNNFPSPSSPLSPPSPLAHLAPLAPSPLAKCLWKNIFFLKEWLSRLTRICASLNYCSVKIASYFGPSLKVSISSLRLLRQQLLIVSNWQAPFPLSLTKF